MMSESKMVEFFSILSALAGAILCFAGENEKSKGFGIVLLILAVLCIIIIAPIFRAKEMAAQQKGKSQKESKKCPSCGKKIEDEWEICPYCQTYLISSEDNEE